MPPRKCMYAYETIIESIIPKQGDYVITKEERDKILTASLNLTLAVRTLLPEEYQKKLSDHICKLESSLGHVFYGVSEQVEEEGTIVEYVTTHEIIEPLYTREEVLKKINETVTKAFTE